MSAILPDEYSKLVEAYREGLFEQALAIVDNREDAEDVVQETFCEVMRDPQRLSTAQSPGALLSVINRGNALNRLRSRGRSKSARMRQAELSESSFTTGGFSAVELRETIQKAIKRLSPKLQEAVVLRFWQNLSYKEMAVRLKIEPGAVQQRLLLASEKLYADLRVQFGWDSTSKGEHK